MFLIALLISSLTDKNKHLHSSLKHRFLFRTSLFTTAISEMRLFHKNRKEENKRKNECVMIRQRFDPSCKTETSETIHESQIINNCKTIVPMTENRP